jgi:hypothetical protein
MASVAIVAMRESVVVNMGVSLIDESITDAED